MPEVFKCKIVFFPSPGDKNFQEARSKGRYRRSIDRSFPLPAIIIRRHPRVEPLFRRERDRTEGGRKENGEKRRDADLEAFTTSRAFPIVILSPGLSHSLSRRVGERATLLADPPNDIRGYVARWSAKNRRLFGTLAKQKPSLRKRGNYIYIYIFLIFTSDRLFCIKMIIIIIIQ